MTLPDLAKRTQVVSTAYSPSQVKKVCFVSTSNYALGYFLDEYIDYLCKDGEVTLVSNSDHGMPAKRVNQVYYQYPIQRTPNPLHDARTVFDLCRFMRKQNFDVVYSISPKGGLVGMLAALFARVPIRIHIYTGQVWYTKKGIWRTILKSVDSLTGFCTTEALVDSHSQRDFLITEKVVSAGKSSVIGSGSVCGVKAELYQHDESMRKGIRLQLGIDEEDTVVLFLGRLSDDKGIADLIDAFVILATKKQSLWLLIVGPDDGMLDLLKARVEDSGMADRIKFLGKADNPQVYYSASDIICLPSYREGFGNVIIEAACASVPALASNIYGLRDSVVNGVTGLLHDPGSCEDIVRKLTVLIEDLDLRLRLGKAAKERAETEFSSSEMTIALARHLSKLESALPK